MKVSHIGITKENANVFFFREVNMGSSNFYSYLYALRETEAFDELSEHTNLSDPNSIQEAFRAYLKENNPPLGIKDALLEEKFYKSPNEGDCGNQELIRYEMVIPGIPGKVEIEGLRDYFEYFLDKIGSITSDENSHKVDLELSDNERGGTDLYINIDILEKRSPLDKVENNN